MKESYGEGLANHTGPESCASGREAAGEALTGVPAGWVLSLETPNYGVPTPCMESGRQHRGSRRSERPGNPAGSQTPGTLGNSPHRNWDIPRPAPPARSGVRVMNPERAR